VSTAHADPPSFYVGGQLALGLDGQIDWMYAGAAFDGGYRISPAWWLHARVGGAERVATGNINGGVTTVSDRQVADARVGLEVRPCWNPGTCAIFGADLGYRLGGTYDGTLFATHLGLDRGGDHLRFRPAIEAALVFDHGHSSDIYLPDAGIEASLGVAYVW
jgi:hypothetical protein